LSLQEQFGPDAVIDYLRDDWPDGVKALTDGRGADVIFDGNAGDRAPMNLDAVAPMGHIVYLGASAGQAPPVPPSMLIAKAARCLGLFSTFIRPLVVVLKLPRLTKPSPQAPGVFPLSASSI
jgi:NADPH:quinone reductase-like Zn-dependent oxidoreductase